MALLQDFLASSTAATAEDAAASLLELMAELRSAGWKQMEPPARKRTALQQPVILQRMGESHGDSHDDGEDGAKDKDKKKRNTKKKSKKKHKKQVKPDDPRLRVPDALLKDCIPWLRYPSSRV